MMNAEKSSSRMDSQRRILIVDDNPDAAESLAMLFELEGHQVRTAYTGEDALAIGADFKPGVMLLDIGMPDLSGYEVAQRLRMQDWGENVTLIALTGWGREEDKERARTAGFDAHLVKPVDLSTIGSFFSSRQAGAI